MFIVLLVVSYILLFILFLSVFRLAKNADYRRGQLWEEYYRKPMTDGNSVTSEGQLRKTA